MLFQDCLKDVLRLYASVALRDVLSVVLRLF